MIAVLITGSLLFAAAILFIEGLNARKSQRAALELVANAYSTSILTFQDFYANVILSRLHGSGIQVTHDYANKEKALPIPATMSLDLIQFLNNRDVKASMRLVSENPFPWRQARQLSEFDQNAFARFRTTAEKSFAAQFMQGQHEIFEFAVPVRMTEPCVACHNAHPDSPKRDWKIGDIRGIQVVTLRPQVFGTDNLEQRAYLIVAVICFFAFTFSAIFWLIQRNNIALRVILRDKKRLAEARDAAEAANRAKGAFLSSMSHELRTPLNAILGFGQLLEIDTEDRAPEQQESVKYILTAGHQMLGLVNDLLDFARIDNGKLALNIHRVRIADLVSSCVEQVRSALANKQNVTIENGITDIDLVVQGDDLRIRQVLINLLSNAVKYNQENGQVTISSVIGNVGNVGNESRLRIEVKDTGCGIAIDKLSLLFSPFERLEHSSGSIPGLGIGLHIAKQLVEAMHGTIGVESVQGRGSTFWFELPVAEATEEPAVAPGKAILPAMYGDARFVVLYIEDNPANVQLVKKALQGKQEIELLTARTAEEGLTLAEEDRPDLILMDIQLPGIDGVTATKLLKEIVATRDIPVVALSASAMKEDIERALSSGCVGYMTKPLELQALYELIDGIRRAGK